MQQKSAGTGRWKGHTIFQRGSGGARWKDGGYRLPFFDEGGPHFVAHVGRGVGRLACLRETQAQSPERPTSGVGKRSQCTYDMATAFKMHLIQGSVFRTTQCFHQCPLFSFLQMMASTDCVKHGEVPLETIALVLRSINPASAIAGRQCSPFALHREVWVLIPRKKP